jgi:long-chain acyl-CoA synthetase
MDIVRGPRLPSWLAELTGETLSELLIGAVGRGPQRMALVWGDGPQPERWDYADLLRRSEAAAGTLLRRGLQPGDRLLTWADNDPWLVAAYFGAWRIGAVLVPLDKRMATDVALRVGRRTRPKLLLAGANLTAEQTDGFGVPMLRVSAEDLAGDPQASEALPPPPAPDTLAEILFTSGTTADPKGVALTHAQMIHNVRCITLAAGRGRERGLVLLPLSHMYGQMVPLFHGLLTGSQMTFPATLTPRALVALLRRDRITAITGVPALLRLLLDGIESEARKQGRLDTFRRALALARLLPMPLRRLLFRDIHRRFGGELRILSCGGAKLTPELQLAWEHMGVLVVQGYGATECAAVAGHTRHSRRPGTVGPPFTEIEVRIAPDGEILARGPNVMEGYWEQPEETARVIVDGWAHTGDAGRFEEHGELVILGRTRDRIALPSGLKVYPEDVESALIEEPAVRAAVVLDAGEGLLGAVLVAASADTTDDELGEAVTSVNGRLAQHQRIRRWRRWPEEDFPRTHTLKIRREPVASRFSML